MPAFRRIVFATTRPVRMIRLQPILRTAGIEAAPVVMDPQRWCETPAAQSECLVFLDSRSAPSWEKIAAARRGAVGSRFVLCSRIVTPELVRSAMECGIDGVLSTGLPEDDAVSALLQICQGERQFRFEPVKAQPAAMPVAVPADFDMLWMFGEA
jgi:hypothetical protein